MDNSRIPGWFGKVPMLGDFANRRMPADVVQVCDAWLSECIAASRQALGEAWLDTYLSAPVWCFAWAPRVADGSWWFGVLMPSVDAVGRYFPLVVCRDSPQVATSSHELSKLADWYDAVEHSALATLQPTATLESFEEALAGICGLPDKPDDRIELHESATESVRSIDLDPGASWPSQAPEIVLRSLVREFTGHSLWWTKALQPQPGRVTLVRGLPSPERFTQMMQGAA